LTPKHCLAFNKACKLNKNLINEAILTRVDYSDESLASIIEGFYYQEDF